MKIFWSWLAEVETIFEESGEHRARARMAAFAQTLDDRFLVEIARFAQLSQRGEKAVILRLGERVRREQNRGEQQRSAATARPWFLRRDRRERCYL